MTFNIPPQPFLNFDLNPLSVTKDAEAAAAASTKAWDGVALIPPSEASFANAILPLIHADNRLMQLAPPLRFLHTASPAKEIRDASKQAIEIFNHAQVNRFSRSDVFKVVDAVWQKNESLDPESHLYLKQLREQFIKTGQGLSDEAAKAKVQHGLVKISDLSMGYLRNIDYDVGGLWLTLEELRGVPQSDLDRWKADGDKRWVDHKLPNYTTVIQNAVNDEVRQKVWLSMENRMKDKNVQILQEILILRDEKARILGYKHHAELRESDRILKTDEALRFLQTIRSVLQGVGKHELESLKSLKATKLREEGSDSSALASHFFPWDRAFYEHLAKKKEHKIDQDKVAEYFPFDRCLSRQLSILGVLFGVTFFKCTPDAPGFSTWHPDVIVYTVWDDDSKGGDFLGYLYLDVYPRDHKYSHKGHFKMQPGFTKEDGSRHYPCAAFMTNYSPPTATRPSLLKISDVVSCFHELGHSLHNLCSKTKYATFHGTATPRDFVEIPSIMLEYIFWNRNIVRFISGHYTSDENPEKELKLPDDLIDRLISLQFENTGLSNLHNLWFSQFDLNIHTPASHQEICEMNLAAEFNKLTNEITLTDGPGRLDGELEETQGFCRYRFPVGYSSSYYTYLLSRSFSYDIFESKFRPLLPTEKPTTLKPLEDVNDIITAKLRHEFRRYREIVLQPGGNVTSYLGILKEFLGRDASHDAYIQRLKNKIQ